MQYDAFLLVSFGGPEGPDEVIPFLENVLRGRNVPRERMLEVAEHYQHFGGVSPINAQNRALLAAVGQELRSHDIDLRLYWGNRNWHPFLADTVQQMKQDGVRRALAFMTSAYSSYSGCRQYREDVARARSTLENPPVVDKLRVFYNHPGFIGAQTELLRATLKSCPGPVLFTAHSLPMGMSDRCRYAEQLTEAARLVAEAAGVSDYRLVYQSRSGPPSQPWLEPDVLEVMRTMQGSVVLCPVGFISDHMEILYDLDTEARDLAAELGLRFARCPTVGTHPRFVSMVRELVEERLGLRNEREALGRLGPSHDVCPETCCLPR
ncbi:ferrochelatase [bacterium CPR1]|nr:ferrochelatase [bacterium CPR1]